MAFTNTEGDGSGTSRWLRGNSEGELIDAWHPGLQIDEALNDSDKTFTVTANEEWRIQSIWVEFASTAAGGNRQMVIEIQDDSADVIARVYAGIVQADTLSREYMFAPHVVELTAFRATVYLSTRIPSWILPAGYKIRVYDITAVDAAADDMIVQIITEERDAP